MIATSRHYRDAYARVVHVNTLCGSTADFVEVRGCIAPPRPTIYLDFGQQRANLSRFGDGSVGFWLAHEFGHHIQNLCG